MTSQDLKTATLLCMDDLKLCAQSEKELDSRIQTVRVGKQFGIEKYSTLVMKGRSNQTESNTRRQSHEITERRQRIQLFRLITDRFQISNFQFQEISWNKFSQISAAAQKSDEGQASFLKTNVSYQHHCDQVMQLSVLYTSSNLIHQQQLSCQSSSLQKKRKELKHNRRKFKTLNIAIVNL